MLGHQLTPPTRHRITIRSVAPILLMALALAGCAGQEPTHSGSTHVDVPTVMSSAFPPPATAGSTAEAPAEQATKTHVSRPESPTDGKENECSLEPVGTYLSSLKKMLDGFLVVTATITTTHETKMIVDNGDPESPENLVYTRISLNGATPIAGRASPKTSQAWLLGGVKGADEYRHLQALYAWAEDGKAVVVLSKQADGQTYVGGVFPLVDGQVVLDLSCITSEGVTAGAGHFAGTVNVGFDGQPTPRTVDMGTISLVEFSRQLAS